MKLSSGTIRSWEIGRSRLGEVEVLVGDGVRVRSIEWRHRRRSKSHLVGGRRRVRGGVNGNGGSRRAKRGKCSFWMARARKGLSLETHVWFAKRFHLGRVCGTVIPLRAVDRGTRSAVRAAEHGVVVADISFVRCFELRPSSDSKIRAEPGFGSVMMKQPGPEDRQPWVFAHPESPQLGALRRAGKDITHRLVRLRLIGPEARRCLNRSLGIQLSQSFQPSAAKIFRDSDHSYLTSTSSIEALDDITQRSCYVVILPTTPLLSGGFGAGLDLLLPSGWAMHLWIKLVYSGAVAVGAEELRSIGFEGGCVQYPHDCPRDVSRIFRGRGKTGTSRVKKRRREGKRLLLDRDMINEMFRLDIGDEQRHRPGLENRWVKVDRSPASRLGDSDIVLVRLKAGAKGIPRDGGLIFAPNADDVDEWTRYGASYNGRFATDEDKHVGTITTGAHSLLRGRGFASSAWLYAIRARDLFRGTAGTRKRRGTRQVFLLFRNRQSRWLRTALAEPLLDPCISPF
ncbi:hypothetical protein NDN08_004279 [Rhodosorus marinus]|uniref:POPLD domain-containing protein n=1 Tax=Rhodosorus marinus TaxID=101924 RepID=A0AAV8UKU1_9RHOD|nr:hypothetical protein NDN08_004279 [Rhodosorus marinus]